MDPAPLENDPANPCIGCGPSHPHGLRLAFRRAAEGGATTRLADLERYNGWPGRLHSGILYLAMLETANWTVYAALGRVGLPVRTGALAASRWVATSETLTLAGKPTSRSADAITVAVEATDERGARVATLERAYDLPDREAFRQRMGYDVLPPELEGLL